MSQPGVVSYTALESEERESRNAVEVSEQYTEQGRYTLPPSAERMRLGGDAESIGQRSRELDEEPSKSAAKARVRQADTTNCWVQWWKELLAILAGVAFLVAVYAVLLNIHNTRLQNWSMPFDMQPTALIAVLVTLSRIFLLAVVAEGLSQLKWVYFQQRPRNLEEIEHFDSASRGAFGSIVFLSKISWKAWLASIGAVITILVLAMEPFAQQALSFESTPTPHPLEQALLPRAFNYDWNTASIVSAGQLLSLSTNPHTYAPMIEAILTGLYNPNKPVDHTCRTGNCTWPPVESLGVCVSCADISSSVTKECHEARSPYIGPQCTYKTPDGITLKLSCMIGQADDIGLMDSKSTDLPLPGIVRAHSVWVDSNSANQYACGAHWNASRFVATQCTFKWCMKQFQSQVINGVLSEEVIASSDLFFPKGCSIDPGGPDPHGNDANLGRYMPGAPLTWVYAGYRHERDAPRNPCGREWWKDNSSTLWINSMDHSSIVDNMNEIFTQSISTQNYTTLSRILYTVNNKNLTLDAMGVADGLTNMIRKGPNTTSSTGQTLTTEIIIRVNWLWLIYPSIIVLLTFVFFAATIIFSTRRNRVVWKSSSLAMLFHGIAGLYDPSDNAPLNKTSEMKEAAKQFRVQLDPDENGRLKLVRE